MKRLAALILLIGACAPAGKFYLKPGYQPPERLAVLPLDNHTNDLDGPDLVRYWLNERMAEKKGYRTIPLEEVDAVLERHGIKDGGQLAALSAEKLGAELQAPALIYGELLDFTYQTTGFLNIRKVRARFKMIDAATGRTLWESEGQGANSSGVLSSQAALQAGLEALGAQVLEKTARSPLRTEIWDMIWNAIEYLPRAN